MTSVIGLNDVKKLDTLLRCAICFEYMNIAMLAQGCSHNYCSLCIRRYICYKQQCPTCLEPVVDSDLKNNRIVDHIIEIFRQSQLDQRCSGNDPSDSSSCVPPASCSAISSFPVKKSNSDDDSSEEIFAKQQQLRSPPPASRGNFLSLTHKSPALSSALHSSGISQPMLSSSRVQSSTQSSSNILSSSNTTQTNADTALRPRAQDPRPYAPRPRPKFAVSYFEQAQKGLKTFGAFHVPCPVCSVEVPTRNINVHLDRCLSADKKALSNSVPPSRAVKRKPLPKLVYNLLSDKELRKKVADVGLPLQGDRKLMIQRHREYTLVYNSECDSANPKSGPDIVREILRSEGSKLLASTSMPSPTSMGRVEKGSSAEEVEKARKSYVGQHKSQFSELVEAARRNRLAAKEKAENRKPSTPPKPFSAVPLFVDSDSDDTTDGCSPTLGGTLFSFNKSPALSESTNTAPTPMSAASTSTPARKLASDSECSNQTDDLYTRKSTNKPDELHLLEESRSGGSGHNHTATQRQDEVGESSTSLPPSQVTSFKVTFDNNEDIGPSPDLLGLFDNINPADSLVDDTITVKGKAVKAKRRQKGRKKRSSVADDSDDSWDCDREEISGKRKKHSMVLPESDEDVDTARPENLTAMSKEKPRRSRLKKAVEVNIVEECSPANEDSKPTRRLSQRVCRTSKKFSL